jgi:hypothetical protein
MAKIKKAQFGYNSGLPKGAKAIPQKDRRPSYIQEADKNITNFTKKVSDKVSDDLKPKNVKKAFKNIKNAVTAYFEKGGSIKKKMKNGGSLSGLKASNKRAGSEKGAWITVQNKALAGATSKAKLTKDKQLGATKMAKRGMSIKKK